METGTVKWYNKEKGFGFISREGGDVFVHHSKITPRGVELNEGDRVSYELKKGPKGMEAHEVKRIG